MTTFYGTFKELENLKAKLAEVEARISKTYDFWDDTSVSIDLLVEAEALELQINNLESTRSRGGLVCRCE